jgi:hypothetical protein
MKLDDEDKKVLAKINRELAEYAENLERIRFVSVFFFICLHGTENFLNNYKCFEL